MDRLGFKGVLLPTGQSCEDSWITAAGLATATERLKSLVALRPGVTSQPSRRGTRLHLLAAHPGRTDASFDTSSLGLAERGSPAFEGVVREVSDLLFADGARHD